MKNLKKLSFFGFFRILIFSVFLFLNSYSFASLYYCEYTNVSGNTIKDTRYNPSQLASHICARFNTSSYSKDDYNNCVKNRELETAQYKAGKCHEIYIKTVNVKGFMCSVQFLKDTGENLRTWTCNGDPTDEARSILRNMKIND